MRNRTDAKEMWRHITDESWARANQINRLRLMVKDPTTLFAYWEVDRIHRQLVSEHFQSEWGKLPFYLQVYDVTHILFDGSNAHTYLRIAVHPEADNWYLTGLQAGRNYLADFGTVTWQGQFFPILRSNGVETPPQASGNMLDPTVRFEALRGAAGSSWVQAQVQPQLQRQQLNSTAIWPKETTRQQADWQEQFDGYHLAEQVRGGA